MNLIIKEIEKTQLKSTTPFKVGDIICVNFKIFDKENKGKSQNFEGLVIAINKNGLNSTCTLRKISFGEGVEKVFFINSPTINSIQVKKSNIIRQSKIYYIRHKKNKLLK